MTPDMFVFWLRGYLDSLKGQDSWNGRWEDVEAQLDKVRFQEDPKFGGDWQIAIHEHGKRL